MKITFNKPPYFTQMIRYLLFLIYDQPATEPEPRLIFIYLIDCFIVLLPPHSHRYSHRYSRNLRRRRSR